MNVLDIMDDLNHKLEPFKKWILENQDNPIIWLGLFIFGLFLFNFTYNALQKEK